MKGKRKFATFGGNTASCCVLGSVGTNLSLCCPAECWKDPTSLFACDDQQISLLGSIGEKRLKLSVHRHIRKEQREIVMMLLL